MLPICSFSTAPRKSLSNHCRMILFTCSCVHMCFEIHTQKVSFLPNLVGQKSWEKKLYFLWWFLTGEQVNRWTTREYCLKLRTVTKQQVNNRWTHMNNYRITANKSVQLPNQVRTVTLDTLTATKLSQSPYSYNPTCEQHEHIEISSSNPVQLQTNMWTAWTHWN